MAPVALSPNTVKSVAPLLALVFQLLVLASCGGKEAAITSGLPSSALLSELTVEEATAGCSRLNAQVGARFNESALAREQCTLYALELTTAESRCIAMRDTCVTSRAESHPAAASTFFEPTQDLGCSDTSQWSGCTATVRALETCLQDVLETYENALDTYTCQVAPTYRSSCLPPIDPYVAIDEVDPRTGQPHQCELLPLPASCRALEDGCSGLPLFALSR